MRPNSRSGGQEEYAVLFPGIDRHRGRDAWEDDRFVKWDQRKLMGEKSSFL